MFFKRCTVCGVMQEDCGVAFYTGNAQCKTCVLKKTHKYKLSNPKQRMKDSAKQRARKKGIEFDLTIDDFDVPEVCPILGIPLVFPSGDRRGPRFNSPSLDRIDNRKGYVKGNVQVVSQRANTMKHDATPSELRLFALWIEETYGGH